MTKFYIKDQQETEDESEKEMGLCGFQFRTLHRSPVQTSTSGIMDNELKIRLVLKIDSKSKLMFPITTEDEEPADPKSRFVITIEYD